MPQNVYYPQGISVSLSGNNTAGTVAQVSSGTLYLAGGNNITLSQNGNSITIEDAPGIGQVQSRLDLWPAGAWGSSTITAQGSASIRYLQIENPITFSRV